MSKAKSAIKVLRTTLKRVHDGWTQHVWHSRVDGKSYVCMEGGVYGYCDSKKHKPTQAQLEAIAVLENIIFERYGKVSIPSFNDAPETTIKEVEEVIKLAIIRLETGGGEMNDEDFDALLEYKEGSA